MNDLREMLNEFKDNYVYTQVGMCTTGVRKDNELIYRILNGMMDRIEQNSKTEIVEDKSDDRES